MTALSAVWWRMVAFVALSKNSKNFQNVQTHPNIPNWHWHHWLAMTCLILAVMPKITTGLALTNGQTDDMPCTLQPATAPFGVIDIAGKATNPDHWTVHYWSTYRTWPTIRLSWTDLRWTIPCRLSIACAVKGLECHATGHKQTLVMGKFPIHLPELG